MSPCPSFRDSRFLANHICSKICPARKLGQIDFRLTLWSNIPSTISEKCNTNVWKQLSNITHSLFYCWPCVYVTLGVGFPIRNSRHATSLVFHFFLRFPWAEYFFQEKWKCKRNMWSFTFSFVFLEQKILFQEKWQGIPNMWKRL